MFERLKKRAAFVTGWCWDWRPWFPPIKSPEPPQPQRIHGRRFLEALKEAGVIRPEDYIQRVVIDVSLFDAVKIYVQRIGDENLYDHEVQNLLSAALRELGNSQELRRAV